MIKATTYFSLWWSRSRSRRRSSSPWRNFSSPWRHFSSPRIDKILRSTGTNWEHNKAKQKQDSKLHDFLDYSFSFEVLTDGLTEIVWSFYTFAYNIVQRRFLARTPSSKWRALIQGREELWIPRFLTVFKFVPLPLFSNLYGIFTPSPS